MGDGGVRLRDELLQDWCRYSELSPRFKPVVVLGYSVVNRGVPPGETVAGAPRARVAVLS